MKPPSFHNSDQQPEVIKKDLADGVIAEANKDGTIYLDKSIPILKFFSLVNLIYRFGNLVDLKPLCKKSMKYLQSSSIKTDLDCLVDIFNNRFLIYS